MNSAVRIVILNYNGEALLPLCLPSVVESAKSAHLPTRVTVLDNESQDQGLEYVHQTFPEVTIEKATVNRVLCSYNEYLPKITEPIVILLNNDIRVEPDFVDPLAEKFLFDPKTFLVAPRVMSFDGSRVESGRCKGKMWFGIFRCDGRYPGYEKEALTASETFSSGFGAFSREKFLALKGYDERYLPGIIEDVDLGWRARQAGYRLYYEPRSVVYHMGQASFKKKFGASKILVIAHRNTFLFMWKNFSGLKFWVSHLVFLPLRIFVALLKGNLEFSKGFFAALRIQFKR